MKRLDTPESDGASGQSTEGIQPSSPTNPSSSANPLRSEPASSGQSRPGTSSNGAPSRRRKIPNSVTPNACTNCKNARAKCDGAKPVCRRCIIRNVQDSCQYALHTKTAKEQMVREIQRLQRKAESLEEEMDTLGERNSWIERIICLLKADRRSIEIISRLKRGESYRKIAEWLGPRAEEKRDDLAWSPPTGDRLSEAIDQCHRDLADNQERHFWTNVSRDVPLIEHLITLYLTWIHPVHMLFDEAHFIVSFRECSDIYCSSALVNVICAMSCHLLHNTWNDDKQTKVAIDSLQNRFVDETRSLMKSAEYGKMASIQTYAIMFLVELGSGHSLIASSHLRLAVEILIAKQTSEQSVKAEEIMTWGVLTLHTAWSAFTYQKPSAPISTHLNPFGRMANDQADSLWRLYRQPGDRDTLSRPSFAVLTASKQAKLFQIVHENILVYCGCRDKISARSLLDLFQRYRDWKDGLSSDLRNDGNETLPHVLFLHIQYHAALVNLLQPLLHLDYYYQEPYGQLRNVVVDYAKAGLDLLIRYRNTYSNFYFSPLQLFCAVHLCDAIVRYDCQGTDISNAIHFCLTSLEDAKAGYPIAGPLQKMFRLALTDYGFPVPDELERLIGASAQLGPEELLEACTRPSYRQPMVLILSNMEAGLGQDFMNGWQQLCEGRLPVRSRENRPRPGSTHKSKRVEVSSMLNK